MSFTSTLSAREKSNQLKKLLQKTPNNLLPNNNNDYSDYHRKEAHRFDQLRKLFTSLLSNHELILKGNNNNEEEEKKKKKKKDEENVKQKWNAHLTKQYNTYISQLCDSIQQGNKYALRTMCGIIAVSSVPLCSSSSKEEEGGKRMDGDLVHQMVQSLSLIKEESRGLEMAKLLATELANPYVDGRYYVMKSVWRAAGELYDLVRGSKNEVEDDDDMDVTLVADNLASLLLLVDDIPLNQNTLDSNLSLVDTPQNGAHLSDDDDDNEEEDDDDDSEEDDNNDKDSDSDDDSDNDDEQPQPTKKQKTTPFAKNPPKNNNKQRFSFYNIKKLRRLLQESWLSVLRLPLSTKVLKRVLRHLPNHVLTTLKRIPAPLRFADFYSASFKLGSGVDGENGNAATKHTSENIVVSLLSLQGLFHLMTKHNLEYPKFYACLYKLMSHSTIFHVKHRMQFCSLLTDCLMRSQMLPAYVVASFCKRLCRVLVCGGVPPGGALFVLALVSNLIRRHGEIGCLVHRSSVMSGKVKVGIGGKEKEEEGVEDYKKKGMIMDVFDNETNDPSKSRALESSLWELSALENHYHPAVSALAKICGTEDDKTPLYDLDEFLLHTYKSLFDQERKWGSGGVSVDDGENITNKKKRKHKTVALTFQEPKSLFQEGDVFSEWLNVH